MNQFLDDFERTLPLQSFSRSKLIKSIRKDALKVANTKEMIQLLNDNPKPHPEYQALHSIGHIVFHYLSRPPLIDIGGGSFCSANYRDPLGHLTDQGKDLKVIGHTVIEKIIENNHECKDSEYVSNFIDVIDDATKSNTNRYFAG